MSGSDSPTFFHGQPWSSWIEKIGRDKPLSDDEPDNEPASSVMRLSVDDIDLYGFCPERDTFYGVVCEICNSIVKPQALIQHMESRHPTGTASLPPPTNSTTKPVMKTPYCKLSKLKKSQSSGQLSLTNNNGSNSNSSSSNNGSGNGANSKTSNNHTPVKQRTGGSSDLQPQPNLHPGSSPRSPLDGTPIVANSNSNSSSGAINNGTASHPSAGQHGAAAAAAAAATAGGFANALGGVASAASPVKSPGNQPKRKRLKTERSLLKDREYDPDRHCGVWNEESGKPCTRSLTCKAHTVSLRRTVAGRSKSFDKLLADHRAAKEPPAARSGAASAAASASSHPTAKAAVAAAAVAAATSSAVVGSSSAPTPAAAALVAVSIGPAVGGPASAASAPQLLSDVSTVVVANNTTSLPDLEAPSSPPVLSLPDTYPLPQTKLEEDFANELDSSRRVDSSLVNATSQVTANNSTNANNSVNNNSNSSNAIITNNGNSSNSNNNNNGSSSSNSTVMAPISVVLPSLSPIQSSGGGGISPGQAASLLQYSRANSSPLSMEQMLGKQQSPASTPVVPGSTSLLIGNQSTPMGSVVLEAKPAPMDIDPPTGNSMYMSPVHQYGKDAGKLNVRSSQSPSSRSSSFSSLFDTSAASLLDQQHFNSLDAATMRNSHFAASLLTNGNKQQQQQQQRLSSNHLSFQGVGNQSMARGIKSDFMPDYSTAIQLEATAASTPYAATNFEDISWSSHHPEPLAVTKWLRITSSRKQYNFNIH